MLARTPEQKKAFIILVLKSQGVKIDEAPIQALGDDVSVPAVLGEHLIPLIPQICKDLEDNQTGLSNRKFDDILMLILQGDLSVEAFDKLKQSATLETQLHKLALMNTLRGQKVSSTGMPLEIAARAGNLAMVNKLDELYLRALFESDSKAKFNEKFDELVPLFDRARKQVFYALDYCFNHDLENAEYSLAMVKELVTMAMSYCSPTSADHASILTGQMDFVMDKAMVDGKQKTSFVDFIAHAIINAILHNNANLQKGIIEAISKYIHTIDDVNLLNDKLLDVLKHKIGTTGTSEKEITAAKRKIKQSNDYLAGSIRAKSIAEAVDEVKKKAQAFAALPSQRWLAADSAATRATTSLVTLLSAEAKLTTVSADGGAQLKFNDFVANNLDPLGVFIAANAEHSPDLIDAFVVYIATGAIGFDLIEQLIGKEEGGLTDAQLEYFFAPTHKRIDIKLHPLALAIKARNVEFLAQLAALYSMNVDDYDQEAKKTIMQIIIDFFDNPRNNSVDNNETTLAVLNVLFSILKKSEDRILGIADALQKSAVLKKNVMFDSVIAFIKERFVDPSDLIKIGEQFFNLLDSVSDVQDQYLLNIVHLAHARVDEDATEESSDNKKQLRASLVLLDKQLTLKRSGGSPEPDAVPAPGKKGKETLVTKKVRELGVLKERTNSFGSSSSSEEDSSDPKLHVISIGAEDEKSKEDDVSTHELEVSGKEIASAETSESAKSDKSAIEEETADEFNYDDLKPTLANRIAAFKKINEAICNGQTGFPNANFMAGKADFENDALVAAINKHIEKFKHGRIAKAWALADDVKNQKNCNSNNKQLFDEIYYTSFKHSGVFNLFFKKSNLTGKVLFTNKSVKKAVKTVTLSKVKLFAQKNNNSRTARIINVLDGVETKRSL